MTLKIDVFNHIFPKPFFERLGKVALNKGPSRAATECGLQFFGPGQVVFASDAPFDPEGGSMYIRETIKVIDSLEISQTERHSIYQGNAERLFNRSFSPGVPYRETAGLGDDLVPLT